MAPKSDPEKYYQKMLGILGSLTKLFSDNSIPYLNYRVAENLFCRAFNAKNLGRADVSVDAVVNETGWGIKTFVDRNGKNMEKIAEFNKDTSLLKGLSAKEKINKVSELRNERLEVTKRMYKLKSTVYHLISRKKGRITVFEKEMVPIEISKIKNVKEKAHIISFSDSKNEYLFNGSKSTLYQRFIAKKPVFEINVEVIKDPFALLEEKFSDLQSVYFDKTAGESYVILPLYSKKKNSREVRGKSGLNQWNAGGRKRSADEVYIPIPIWIHKRFPGFFPSRDSPFKLVLPDNKLLDVKVCQDNSKALMSKHNADLGKWMLREVLGLGEKEMLTYDKLQRAGFDSVMIEKKENGQYHIFFKATGSYERFYKENK